MQNKIARGYNKCFSWLVQLINKSRIQKKQPLSTLLYHLVLFVCVCESMCLHLCLSMYVPTLAFSVYCQIIFCLLPLCLQIVSMFVYYLSVCQMVSQIVLSFPFNFIVCIFFSLYHFQIYSIIGILIEFAGFFILCQLSLNFCFQEKYKTDKNSKFLQS